MKRDQRRVIRGVPIEMAMTTGELVMLSIMRGKVSGRDLVEILGAVVHDEDFNQMWEEYCTGHRRLFDLIEGRARQRLDDPSFKVTARKPAAARSS